MDWIRNDAVKSMFNVSNVDNMLNEYKCIFFTYWTDFDQIFHIFMWKLYISGFGFIILTFGIFVPFYMCFYTHFVSHKSWQWRKKLHLNCLQPSSDFFLTRGTGRVDIFVYFWLSLNKHVEWTKYSLFFIGLWHIWPTFLSEVFFFFLFNCLTWLNSF